MKSRWFRGLSFVIALGFILAVVSQIEWAQLSAYAQQLSLETILLVFSTYWALNLARVLRYRVLLGVRLPLFPLYTISLYHNFLVRFLPFKLGEASYVLLLKNRLNVPYQAGVSSLFSARLLELLVIMLVGAMTLFLAGDLLPNQGGTTLFLLILTLLGGILGFYYSGRIVGAFARGLARLSWLNHLAQRLALLSEELNTLRHPQRFWGALWWSLWTYAGSFFPNWLIMHSIGVELPPLTLVVIVSMGMFATAFPFSISGFGIVEFSWAMGLVSLGGYSTAQATAIGVLLNGAQQLSAFFLGIVGWGSLTFFGASSEQNVKDSHEKIA